ncbi:MAG: hypothetical protein ACOYJ2_04110 [Rickettsiales bacterium]
MNRLCMLLLLFPSTSFAGAWVQNEGDALFSRQAIFYTTNEYFDIEGNSTPQARFHKKELNLYGEYGWSNHLTLGTNLFLNRVSQNDETNLGIADSEFFARLLVWKTEQSVVSLQPLIKLPSLYQQAGTPRGGTDSTDAELSLMIGHNIGLLSKADYVDMRLGYRERSSGLNAQWRADIAYGVTLTDRLQLVSAIRTIQATQSDPEAFSNNGELDYDLSKAELSALYQLDYWQALQLSYFSHVAGRQTGGGQGFAIGLTQRF